MSSSSNSPKKGSNDSGVDNKSYRDKILGGVPDKKNKDQIEKATRPLSNGRAPGSVRK